MDRNLVIVCAGDQSQHQRFADSRNFDLWVIYYGQSDAVFEDYQRTADRIFRLRGLKWALLRSLIDLHLAGKNSPFGAYRYIFLPDDAFSRLLYRADADPEALWTEAKPLVHRGGRGGAPGRLRSHQGVRDRCQRRRHRVLGDR